MWMAPNLVTLTGLLMNVLTFLLFAAYTPNLTEAAPRWVCGAGWTAPRPAQRLPRRPVAPALTDRARQVYLYSALAMFIYQTLDAIDGKQARRTGAQSPLGQLFDHGPPFRFLPTGAAAGASRPAVRLTIPAPRCRLRRRERGDHRRLPLRDPRHGTRRPHPGHLPPHCGALLHQHVGGVPHGHPAHGQRPVRRHRGPARHLRHQLRHRRLRCVHRRSPHRTVPSPRPLAQVSTGGGCPCSRARP